MEHRWGRRWSVEVAVMVDPGRGVLERGVVCDVSASGLRIRLQDGLHLTPHTPVTILHVERSGGQHRVHRIEAWVVRQSGNDFGVTYPEFNPPEVAALLHLAGDRPAAPARSPVAVAADTTCRAEA
jgi:hypothetical protein